METILKILTVIMTLLLYFVPTFRARGKRKFWRVLIANWFLGWTVIGWILVFVWAGKADDEAAQVINSQPTSAQFCANCGKYSPPGAGYCTTCGAKHETDS